MTPKDTIYNGADEKNKSVQRKTYTDEKGDNRA